MNSEELDPEIAELIDIDESVPNFSSLFDNKPKTIETEEIPVSQVGFAIVNEFKEDPKPFFADKNYYKSAISGEDNLSQKLHNLVSLFISNNDQQDKNELRSKIIPVYWDFIQKISSKLSPSIPLPKKITLRFGALIPAVLTVEQREMLASIILDNKTAEPFYYIDEWLLKIKRGEINPSASDETKEIKKGQTNKVSNNISKLNGERNFILDSIRSKLAVLAQEENSIKRNIGIISNIDIRPEYDGLRSFYGESQKTALNELIETAKKIQQLNREITSLYSEADRKTSELRSLNSKNSNIQEEIKEVDKGTFEKEFNNIRQMAKLCIGRQGNHFPFLMKQYLKSVLNEIVTRENLIHNLIYFENIDPELFQRTFKRQTSRIVPYFILIPCFGDRGICWEPFDKFNKASSRGRLAIPMYPKDLKLAIAYALADLRWQVAKEKGQHYWMEEGITGKYYQWFTAQKKRGDVKESFIQDYVLWVLKESEGMQKLDKEVRGIFWRNIPFPQALKDKLKNRGFVYNELYKKDSNISKSDGY